MVDVPRRNEAVNGALPRPRNSPGLLARPRDAVTALGTDLGDLDGVVDDLMAFITVDTKDIYIDGTNLHIRCGSGSTKEVSSWEGMPEPVEPWP